MATGAAPALEPKAETKTETAVEGAAAQPATLKDRIIAMLHHIFAGRDEYAGWRQ
jgi:hypothetical protein